MLLAIAYALYAISFMTCLKMLQRNNDVFPRLPDQYPIHFGLKGTPDKWVKKGKFTRYFSPGVGLFLIVTMFPSFHFLPIWTEGEVWPEMSLYGGAVTFTSVYLVYGTNEASIEVALGNAEKIWSFLKLPMALFVVGIFIMPVVFMFMPENPELIEARTCSALEKNKPVDEKSVFGGEDEYAYMWTHWKMLNKGSVELKWYDPGGELYYEHSCKYGGGQIQRYRSCWSRIGVPGAKESAGPGMWSVAVTRDDEVLYEIEIRIE